MNNCKFYIPMYIEFIKNMFSFVSKYLKDVLLVCLIANGI